MYKRDENSYNMILGTQKILGKNKEKFKEFPVFKEYFSRLNKDIQKLSTLIRKINRLSKGTHEKKSNLEKLITKETYILGVALDLVARGGKDFYQYSHFKIPKRELMRMRDTERMERSKAILKEVLKQKNILKNYAVPAKRINAFKKLVDDYSKSIGESEVNVIQRKVAGRELRNLFKEIKTYLYFEVDSFMEILEEDYPSFFNAYLKVRNIKDLKKRRNKIVPNKVIKFKKIS